MTRKHKVWCAEPNCRIYSYEGVGVIVWKCAEHDGYGYDFSCSAPKKLSTDQKIDLILDHLKLEVVVEPATAKLVKVKALKENK